MTGQTNERVKVVIANDNGEQIYRKYIQQLFKANQQIPRNI